MAAGSGTQEETIELFSYLIGIGGFYSRTARLKKAALLYKMGRAVDAEELVTEIDSQLVEETDAQIVSGWPESIASLYGAAYLGEPLSETMLEFSRNNQQIPLHKAALLISQGI